MNEQNNNIKDTFSLKVTKKNLKPNAPSYTFKTVGDIFSTLEKKDINKFIKDFKQGLQVGIAMRDLMKALAKENGVEWKPETVGMESFTWIND